MRLNHQPSKQFNKSSNCCGRATGGQLLSSAVSSSLSQLWLHAHAYEHPKRRWSCLGQGCSQQCWTVESASQDAAKSLHDYVAAEPDAIASNGKEEETEETESLGTESDRKDSTGVNENVPTSAWANRNFPSNWPDFSSSTWKLYLKG